MATFTDRLALLITANADQAVREIGKVGKAVDRDLAATRFGAAEKALQKLGISAGASGTLIKAGLAGGAVAGGLAVAKFVGDGVKKFTELTGEIRAFQRVAGTSAEDSSRLVGSMKLLGIEPANAARAFGLLSKNIVTNSAKLSAQGIEVARNKDHTVNLTQTLFGIADAYNKTSDQAKKNTIALTAFGRGGLELVPILKRGSAGLKELNDELARSGLVFDEKALNQGRELTLATRELKDALTGLEIKATRSLIPFITGGAHALTTVEHLAGGVDILSIALGGLTAKLAAGALTSIGAGLISVGGGLETAAGGAGLLTAAAGGLVVPVAGLGVAAVAASRGVDHLVPALGGLDKGVVSLERRIPLVGHFLAGLDSKTLGLSHSQHKAAATAEETTSALEDQASAVKASSDAMASAKKSADDYAAALKGVFDASEGIIGSELGVEDAESSLADAHDSVAEKEKALADARHGLGSGAKQLESATRSLSDAQRENARAATEAAKAVADAEKRVSDAANERGSLDPHEQQSASEDAKRAADDLAKAKADQAQGAEDGARRIADAQAAVNEAQRAGGKNDDIIKASRDLQRAHRDEASAVVALAGARRDFAAQQAEQAGHALTDAEKLGTYRDQLISLKDALPSLSPVRTELEKLISLVPPPIDLIAQAERAKATAAGFVSAFDAIIASMTAAPPPAPVFLGPPIPAPVPRGFFIGPPISGAQSPRPHAAHGGIVHATPGGVDITVAEGGQDEAIVPLPSTGIGGGTTINNHIEVHAADVPTDVALDLAVRKLGWQLALVGR